MKASRLAQRKGHVDAHATLIRAALLASHAAHAWQGGFKASDVRFYFRLFANWVALDLARPALDLQLTQVRRLVLALNRQGQLGRGSSNRQMVLNGAGLLELAEKMVAGVGPSFEEVLFVLHFATSYRDALTVRVLGATTALSSSVRRRLQQLLDPKQIARHAIRSADRLIDYLEHRIETDLKMDEQMTLLRKQGVDEQDLISKLEGMGAYDLDRLRPLASLLSQLPEDLRSAELTRGISERRAALFIPLLERARSERQQLEVILSQVSRPFAQ